MSRERRYPKTYVNAWGKVINPQAIVFCRLALGWTQEELADYIGCNRATVSNWENNHTWPTPLYAQRLALWIERTKKQLRTRQIKPGKKFWAQFANG